MSRRVCWKFLVGGFENWDGFRGVGWKHVDFDFCAGEAGLEASVLLQIQTCSELLKVFTVDERDILGVDLLVVSEE